MLKISTVDKRSDIEIINLYNFVKDHYKTSDLFHLIYSYDLFKFFIYDINESIPIILKTENGTIIGCVIGTVRNLHIKSKNKNIKTLDIDFLCIKESYRGSGIINHLIKFIKYEGLKINCKFAFFTISKNLPKYTSICHKSIYHHKIQSRQIGVKLVESTFNCVYLNGSNIEVKIIDNIFTSLLNFNKRYEISDIKSKDEIKSTFYNKAFSHFLFFENNSLINYFCFYKLELKNGDRKENHLYLYTYFTDKNTNLEYLLHTIFSYCKEHFLCDFITLIDPFGFTETEYANLQLYKGTGSLYYYLENSNLKNINPESISLVPI